MKDSKIRALVIIPSKMDSTRVKNKNLRIISGQTFIDTIIYWMSILI